VVGDTFPDQAVESRMALLERIEKTNALVIATHFPWPGIGQLRQDCGALHWPRRRLAD